MEEEKVKKQTHAEEDEEGGHAFGIVKLALSGIILLLSLVMDFGGTTVLILRICAATISGYEILIKSAKNLLISVAISS